MSNHEGTPPDGSSQERRAPGRERRDLLHRAVRETGADWTVLRPRPDAEPGWEIHLDAAYAEAVAGRLRTWAGTDAVELVTTGGPIVAVVLRD